MRVGGRAALGILSGCVLVAGCSDGGSGDPVTLPPTTASTTAVTTPPPTTGPPTTTDEATPTPTTTLMLPDEHVESVDAFVADFFAALNNAKETGDFAEFDALYLPQCTRCIELRDEVTAWLADGQTVEGGDWVILQQSSSQFDDGSRAVFTVLAYRDAAILGGAPGDAPVTAPATVVLLGRGGLLPLEPWVVEDMGLTEAVG